MAWHWPGDKPLSEPMMVRLPMHICVTRPRWVNSGQTQQSSPMRVSYGVLVVSILEKIKNISTHLYHVMLMFWWSKVPWHQQACCLFAKNHNIKQLQNIYKTKVSSYFSWNYVFTLHLHMLSTQQDIFRHHNSKHRSFIQFIIVEDAKHYFLILLNSKINSSHPANNDPWVVQI